MVLENEIKNKEYIEGDSVPKDNEEKIIETIKNYHEKNIPFVMVSGKINLDYQFYIKNPQ